MPEIQETYVSVDVETAGPSPRQYALLSIGACLVSDPRDGFYVELKPTHSNFTPEAMAVSQMSLKNLAESGVAPDEAMERFEDWLKKNVSSESRPVFVAFNAPFDWMFVNDYFHHFRGANPFGHAALDIKAFYMGMTGVRWSATALEEVNARYRATDQLTHQALQDARDQAALFQQMLRERQGKKPKGPALPKVTEELP